MGLSAARVATWAIAVFVGAVYGVAGTIAHAYRLGVLPVGLLLAFVGAGALLVAIRSLTADRWATLAAGAGLVAAVLVFSGRGPGGSVIVPDGELDMLGPVNLGIVWTIAAPLLVAAVIVWPARRRALASAAD
ncbi:MAG: histidinol dehydrogenase [Microbacterium sp.]|uniref:histidinol dehydrogenase n=1 Tax=Microbacterium sp. TaxID=51671 RepID=UPI0039E36FB4